MDWFSHTNVPDRILINSFGVGQDLGWFGVVPIRLIVTYVSLDRCGALWGALSRTRTRGPRDVAESLMFFVGDSHLLGH